MEDDKGKRKMPEVDEAPQQGVDADATDRPVTLGGDRSGTDAAAAGTAVGGDDVFSLGTSRTLHSGGQLVVAHPEDRLALTDLEVYNPERIAVGPRAIPQQPQPRGSMSGVADEVDISLPLGLQERAAASAVTAAVQAADKPAEAAAAIADAGWHVSVPPSRNLPVHPQERCSSCGLRMGIMVDRPTPHRCLCVECLLENALCPVCSSGGGA